MTRLQITVQDQILTATPDKLLVSRSVGEVTFEANFDSSWADYAITIIFWTPLAQKSVLYTGGEMEVPWEILDHPTDSLRITAVGIKDGHRRPTARMRRGLSVIVSGAIEGDPPREHSPALWEQVMGRLEGGTGGGSSAGAQEAQAKAEEAQRKAEEAEKAAKEAAESAANDRTAAAASRQGATQKAGEAAQSATVAQDAQMGAEAAKDAAEAVRAAIPVPVPGSEDEGKVPVARGTAYRLEAITVGAGGGSELEYIGEYTLAEDVATWEITSDLSGAPLQLRKMYFELDIKPAQINIDNNISNTHARMTVPTWANAYGVNVCVSDYPVLRKTVYTDNPGWGQLWEIQTLNSLDIIFMRRKESSSRATVSAGGAKGPGYITGLGLGSLDPTKAQFGAGSAVRVWGEKV